MKDYNEPCVSLDTATMLQAIGFNWPCYACYDNLGVKGRLYYTFGCLDHNHHKQHLRTMRLVYTNHFYLYCNQLSMV